MVPAPLSSRRYRQRSPLASSLSCSSSSSTTTTATAPPSTCVLLAIAAVALLPTACLGKNLPHLSASEIVLEPVGIDPDDPFSTVHFDRSTKMLFGVVEPTTDDVLCTLSNLGRRVCRGGFAWDPTASDGTVEVTFRAPGGYAIELDRSGGAEDRQQVITFEFRALSGDGPCSDGARRDGNATDVMQSRSGFSPEVNGATAETTGGGATATTLVEVGPCEIYTKVEVDAEALSSSTMPTEGDDKIRFDRVSWTMDYDPNLFFPQLAGADNGGDLATAAGAALEYVYKTTGGMWLKGPNPMLVKVDEPNDLAASVRSSGGTRSMHFVVGLVLGIVAISVVTMI